MQQFGSSPIEMLRSFWRNRGLIRVLAYREVIGRYRGSAFGILWSLFQPILMLAVYTFVFSVVFKARWSVEPSSKVEFALVLFAGLMVFNIFSECITQAPGLIIANTNYVKRVVFPLEILPIVSAGSALFHGLVSLCVWLTFYVITIGVPHYTVLLLPFVLLPLMLIVLGVSWLLASLGVYIRDVSQIIGIVVTVLMFLSPIFYPVTALPDKYRPILHLNPLCPAIEQMREVLYWGRVPDITMYSVYFISSLVVAGLGFAWFQKTRKGFADVL